MEGDSMYSIKWYKGKREFYRYTPKDPQSIKTFPVAGISVEVSLSTMKKELNCCSPMIYSFLSVLQTTLSNATQVVISQVDPNMSGRFSCEGG